MDDNTMRLAMSLAEIVTRNTYNIVSTKITLIREKKKVEEQQAAYEDIINSLLQDKIDLERLAGEYKDMYEKITISEKDIEQLQNTVQQLFKQFSNLPGMNEAGPLLALINKDTIKTMQLLGFNFKEAIGEPLTEACAGAIKRSLGSNTSSKNKSKK
jgi:hypothetical protein